MYRLTQRAAAKRKWHPKPMIAVEDQRPEPRQLPHLRRVAIIIDYDSGEPVMHLFEMLRTPRVDSYKVVIDGRPLRQRAGWSAVCDRMRRAMPRLASMRNAE